MPTLTIYKHQDFPSIYNWQAIAFMRCDGHLFFKAIFCIYLLPTRQSLILFTL